MDAIKPQNSTFDVFNFLHFQKLDLRRERQIKHGMCESIRQTGFWINADATLTHSILMKI